MRSKEEINAYHRKYYHEHREKMLLRNKEKYLRGKCSICGIEYNGENGAIFDFHHINPEEKEYRPSTLSSIADWERVKKELDKCILVCSNCHRLIHKKY